MRWFLFAKTVWSSSACRLALARFICFSCYYVIRTSPKSFHILDLGAEQLLVHHLIISYGRTLIYGHRLISRCVCFPCVYTTATLRYQWLLVRCVEKTVHGEPVKTIALLSAHENRE
jgi:hypothetical protein